MFVRNLTYNGHMQNIILSAFQKAHKRLFLLDYDGTLVNLMPTPPEAIPTPALLELLTKLGSHPQNTVVIVSGRRYEELERWFGALPISLVGEHGLLSKKPGQNWEATQAFDTSWKAEVQAVIERYHTAVPGSIVEDKTNGYVWHYRAAADTAQAEQAQQQLTEELRPICERLNLKLMPGSKIVEVLPNGFSKGVSTTYWLDQAAWDFVLVAGDDTTDEDMFRAAPDTAFTIKVGLQPTIAQHHLNSPSDMLELLGNLNAIS
jgi:trehalose 6-phosphate synthase/phosphatase